MAKKQKRDDYRLSFNLPVNLYASDIADSILASNNWEDDAVFEFIKALDLGVASYDFTEKVCKYLVSELKSENPEFKLSDIDS